MTAAGIISQLPLKKRTQGGMGVTCCFRLCCRVQALYCKGCPLHCRVQAWFGVCMSDFGLCIAGVRSCVTGSGLCIADLDGCIINLTASQPALQQKRLVLLCQQSIVLWAQVQCRRVRVCFLYHPCIRPSLHLLARKEIGMRPSCVCHRV